MDEICVCACMCVHACTCIMNQIYILQALFVISGTQNDGRDGDESVLTRFIESLVDLLVRVPLV